MHRDSDETGRLAFAKERAPRRGQLGRTSASAVEKDALSCQAECVCQLGQAAVLQGKIVMEGYVLVYVKGTR